MIEALLFAILLILILQSNKETARWNAEQERRHHDPLADVKDSDAFLIRRGLR